MADFDIQGAKSAGYSDAEIISHLSGSRSFDVDGARKAGYSDQEILSHLSTAPQDTAHHDEGTTAIGKIRNYLGTGDTTKKLDPNTMGEGPNMPAWATNVGLALSLIEPGIAVGSALRSGGPAAAQFVKEVLEHPKTVTAMKDAAVAWVKELPGVKATIQTAKSVGSVKDVIDDVRAARAVAEVPTAATPPPLPPNGVPLRPPLAEVPPTPPVIPDAPPGIGWVPANRVGRAYPVKPPLAPLPEATDVGIHGGIENTPIPRPADPAITTKLNDLLRKVKIEGGFDPDKPLGEVRGGRYLAKFDEGGGEAPVIQSQLRKPTSGVEPANPSLIAKDIGEKLAGRITVEQFDSMSKNPKALAVITRQYGVEADPDLIAMIRRRIKAKTADVPSNAVISIADLMRTK